MRGWLILVLGLFAMNAAAEDFTPRTLEHTGFANVLAESGKILIAGQPDENGLARAKAEGVTRIVNLRTPAEMSARDAPDEAAASKALGLDYVQIPLGGEDAPFTPAAVEQFAEAVESADGKVLLHCRSGRRASYLWAAWLVKYKGVPVHEAVDLARQVNFGTLPLEELLGKKLTITTE